MKRLHAFALLVPLALGAAPAAAAADGPAPAVMGAPVVIRLTGNGAEADVHLVVGNDGPAGTATVRLVDTETGGELPLRREGAAEFATSVEVALPAHAPTSIDLRVRTGRGAVHGQVVVQPAGGKAATGAFKTEREPQPRWLVYTALLFLPALGVVVDAYRATAGEQRRPVDEKILVNANWSFTNSWAVNITAVTAVLGTVLAASGFAGAVLEGVSLTRFVGMNILFGLVTLAAPVVFRVVGAAQQTPAGAPDEVRLRGFLAAAWLVLGAALGVLGVLAVMTHMASQGNAVKAAVWTLLGLIAVVFAGYVFRSTKSTAAKPDPGVQTVPLQAAVL